MPNGLTGFASYAALGVPTTTGGAGGAVVTATTYEDLVTYAAAEEPLIIQIQGTVNGPATGFEKVRVNSNKTIIGLGSDATLSEIGLRVAGTQGCDGAFDANATYVANVIIRNIHFTNLFDYKSNPDPDGVTIECFSHHVWVDHNSFIYPANKADQGKTDGALDVKRGADYVTISWNHFYHYNKTSLVGHVDSNAVQDSGRLHVTYHHNYFENTQQRHPRVRFGKVHLFNNYLFNDKTGPTGSQISYYTLAGPESELYIEANNLYVDSGELYVVSEDSASDAKVTFTADNSVELFNPGAEWFLQVDNGLAFDPADFYDYAGVLTPVADLRTLVPANAGAGNL